MKWMCVCMAGLICLALIGCGGSAKLRLGECPLTVTVKAEDDRFDGYANIYIDGNFIGTTDARSKTLKINLKKGGYTLVVRADGYRTWENEILLLGKGYKQTVLARLEKL